MKSFDVLIVGGGPAGCSAALTLKNRGLSSVVAYTGLGELSLTHMVNNYPGMYGKSGKEIINTFHAELQTANIPMVKGKVTAIYPMGEKISILVDNDIYEAKAVLLAVGAHRVKGLVNEDVFLGRGVSYCATCDGMLYKGKNIVVISAHHEGVEEANFLANIANTVTYIQEKKHSLDGLDERIALYDGKPLEILGEMTVQAVKTKQGTLPADGIFILRQTVAPSQLINDLQLEGNTIWHDANMRTNIERIYVAGDIAGVPLQVAKAVGEGNIAALSIAQDLK